MIGILIVNFTFENIFLTHYIKNNFEKKMGFVKVARGFIRHLG